MTAKTIGVIQVKGGAGRSTLATNMAGELAKIGRTVLIDGDMPQGTRGGGSYPLPACGLADLSTQKRSRMDGLSTQKQSRSYAETVALLYRSCIHLYLRHQ